jgi:CDP-diglyceride synthetase
MRSHFLGLLLFFAILTIILFQALGIYSEELFSNRLRLRTKIKAWSAAFCILLFMYQILQFFPQLTPRNLVYWYITSLGLFCLERLLMLRLYRS